MTADPDRRAGHPAGTPPPPATLEPPTLDPPTLDPPTLGVVLAGGLARRMGGGDKPLRPLGGVPMLERVLRALRPQVAALLLNAGGDPARFAAWGLPVVPDDIPDHAGPLAGVLAGLDWAAARRPDVDWVASVPGDTPFLPPDLVPRLHAARRAAGTMLACAASGERTHPPVALWPVALRHDLRAALLGGERRIDRWTARHGCAVAAWPAGPADPFFNANTPEELADAERRLRDAGAPPTSAITAAGAGPA